MSLLIVKQNWVKAMETVKSGKMIGKKRFFKQSRLTTV
jgi:hypothetical protein